MPSVSTSFQSFACTRSNDRARCVWFTVAAAWLLCSSACRDTREDANYCNTCPADGTTSSSTGTQEGETTAPPGDTSNSADPSGPQTSAGGAKANPPATMSGTGNTAQGASNAAASGGMVANSGNNAPTAGTRAAQAGGAARGGRSGDSAPSGGQPDAATGGDGPDVPRDGGSGEPAQPDAGAPVPCNGPCPNQTPVCDESKAPARCVQCTAEDQYACTGGTSTCDVAQNKCVECTRDDARYCTREASVCNAQNRCVVCTSDRPESCPPAQPWCDDEQRCVECLPGMASVCPPDRSMCNENGQCVECMNDSQCLDPAHPRCDTQTNSCIGCEGSSDCARFPSAMRCDKEIKACVACSPSDPTHCGVGTFCDPNLFICVPGTPTRTNCAECNSDTECGPSPTIAACIEQDNDRYCFTATASSAPPCPAGYSARSASGRPDMYCQPNGSLSCKAIDSAVKETICSNAEQCGRGGQCPMPDGPCKLQCNGNSDCPDPLTCDQTARFCKK